MNQQAESLAETANRVAALEGNAKPSDLIKITVQSQLFVISCTLMSNVANRASDGVSQLFKQQS